MATNMVLGSIDHINTLQKTNPWVTDDIKNMMGQFYKEGVKLDFEKAEKENNVSFFERTYRDGWNDCMIAYRNGFCGYYITFNNYDTWIKRKHPELVYNLFEPEKSQSEKEWGHKKCKP